MTEPLTPAVIEELAERIDALPYADQVTSGQLRQLTAIARYALALVGEVEGVHEALANQRRQLGAMHDETIAELKCVREVATQEIEQLQAECAELRAERDTLRGALEKIRDDDRDRNCEHNNENCCAVVKHPCAFCDAAAALRGSEER